MQEKRSGEICVLGPNDQEGGALIGLSPKERAKLEYEFFGNFPSIHTRKCYRRDIHQFTQYIADHFEDIKVLQDIERAHVVAYRNWLTELEQAPKSINRKLSSISSYFDFLVEKNFVSINPCQSIKRPRQEVKTPTNDLSDDEVRRLMETLETKTASAPLHRAVIYLLFSTGIRKAELINLKMQDIFREKDHVVIKVKAKGGKYLEKVLHPKCVEILDEYISWMKANERSMEKQDFLLRPTRNPNDAHMLDRPLDPKSIDYIVKSWCKKAGIFTRISPHSARATYIGSALEAGVDLYRVGQDVGHASVHTTQMYDKRRRRHESSPTYSLGYFKKSS